MKIDRWNLALAVTFAALSLLTLFVWIPADVQSGIVDTFRRRTTIGDAMTPTVTAAAILAVSIVLGISALTGRGSSAGPALDFRSADFLTRLVLVVAISLGLMATLGPLTVDVLNQLGADIGSYRQLRDTAPYKYIGFAVGGFTLVFGLIRTVEGRFSIGAALFAAIGVVALVLLYDVPFDDFLLPPNGDY